MEVLCLAPIIQFQIVFLNRSSFFPHYHFIGPKNTCRTTDRNNETDNYENAEVIFYQSDDSDSDQNYVNVDAHAEDKADGNDY